MEQRLAKGPSLIMQSPLLCGVLLIAAQGLSARADAMRGDELLKNLRDFDSAFTAALTLEGTEIFPRSPYLPGVPPVPMKWKLTMHGERCAVTFEAAGLPKPEYVKEKRRWVRHDSHGNTRVSIVTGRTVCFCPKFTSDVVTETLFRVSPANQAEVVRTSRTVNLYAPDAATLIVARDKALWTTGRGFSRYLRGIQSIEQRPDGLLGVKAVGFHGPEKTHGTWELVVDPNAAYLVREARYQHDQRDSPSHVIENTGLRWIGSCCLPERGSWTRPHLKGNKNMVQCQSARLEEDRELLTQAEKLVQGPHPAGTTIIDYRMAPPFVQELKTAQSPVPAEFIRVLTTTQAVNLTPTTRTVSALSEIASNPHPTLTSQAAQMTESQLLELLRAAEASYRNVEFEASFQHYNVDPDGKRLTPKNTHYRNVKVRLAQPAGGRFYLEYEGRRPGATGRGGPLKLILSKHTSAYNGEIHTLLNYYSPGGKWAPFHGLVSKERDRANTFSGGRHIFLDLFAPFYRDKGLAATLENAEGWKVHSQEAELVDIRMPWKASKERDVLIRLDLSKGANIVSQQIWDGYGTDLATQLRNVKVALRREGDLWVPKSAKYYKCQYFRALGRSGPYEEFDVTFSAFRCNLPLSDDAFTVAFPPGLRVQDKIANVIYRVGPLGEKRKRSLERPSW